MSSYVEEGERAHIEHTSAADMLDHEERYRFAAQFIKDCDVLDIASGTGYGTDHLRKSGAKSVTGVDVSHAAVAECRRLFPDTTYLQGSMVDFDAGLLYDRIVSFETIEHFDDYKGGLRNLHRLLKPGGTLILSTPNRPVNSPRLKSLADRPNHRFHVREFNVEEMRDALAEAGFKDIRIYGQKSRWMLKPRPLYLAYAAIAQTGIFRGHFSAKVLPIPVGAQPRYTVYVCRR